MNAARPVATDLAALLRALDLASDEQPPELAELAATCVDGPASTSFWDEILADAGLRTGRLRSRPERAIELYYDAIVRHAAAGAVALSALEPDGQFRHLSYAELDASATACAGAWSLAGLEAGDVVALLMPVGVTWLIAFAAALRLGLTVSCLGSLGEEATCRRLRALAPKRVVFDPAGAPPPAEFAAASLGVSEAGRVHVPRPWAYAPDQTLAQLFSPVRAPSDRPVKLSARTALYRALRDARFAYRLGPKGGLGMPGFPLEQHQPAVILATLLSGSRFVELPISTIARAPSLLAQSFLTTLGVSPELRDVLRQAPAGALAGIRDLWRSVDEPLDWPAWQDFIRKQGLQKVSVGNLLVDAASGGALLLSVRRPGSINAFVVPAPGSPYVLADVGSGAPTAGASGVFTLGTKPDPKNPGWFMLAKRGPEYLYGSTVLPRRAGRVFAESEVVDCALGIPGVDGACVVPVATGDPATVWAFVLVVFAGELAESARETLAREVDLVLRERLGSDFTPDQIQVFPLCARRDGEKLDQSWCRRQYSSGFLPRKAGHPAFRRLTALRVCLGTDLDDAR